MSFFTWQKPPEKITLIQNGQPDACMIVHFTLGRRNKVGIEKVKRLLRDRRTKRIGTVHRRYIDGHVKIGLGFT